MPDQGARMGATAAPEGTATVVLLRHGESTANAAGLFTGFLDVPLSRRGRLEAEQSARQLTEAHLIPQRTFCSTLRRAVQTADIVTERLGTPAPLHDWRLNERNYGALTGRTKTEVVDEVGREQFTTWRRTVDGLPPAMTDEQFRAIAAMHSFDGVPTEALTRTESLRMVMRRVGTFLSDALLPAAADGGVTLVVAHGNSLRALCALLDDLNEAEITALNLPTGFPLVYRLGVTGRPLERGGRYLDVQAHAAAAEVAAQGGT